MKLIIDTREQLSYRPFFEGLGLECVNRTLKTGDYSVEGYENSFAVERKSLNDFLSSITQNRARFARELERAKRFGCFAVIIEADYFDIRNKNYLANIEPEVVFATIYSWMIKYQIPIIFVGNREGGAIAVYKLCKAFLRYYRSKDHAS